MQAGDLRRDVVTTVDYLRAQVSCALSLFNLLITLLNLALSAERCSLDSTKKNLMAMQRQVKGLQTEYERVTAGPDAKAKAAGGVSSGEGGSGGVAASLAAEEAAALKKTVDRLIAEKQQLQDVAEAADKAAKSSEARVTAMVSQMKGFDKEFDRLLDENKALKAKLEAQQQQQQHGGGGLLAAAAQVLGAGPDHKKDD